VQLVIQATKQLIVLTAILLHNAMHALFKAIAATPVTKESAKSHKTSSKTLSSAHDSKARSMCNTLINDHYIFKVAVLGTDGIKALPCLAEIGILC